MLACLEVRARQRSSRGTMTRRPLPTGALTVLVGWSVHHPPLNYHSRRAATIEVHPFIYTEIDHRLRELGQRHSRFSRPAPIDSDEEKCAAVARKPRCSTRVTPR